MPINMKVAFQYLVRWLTMPRDTPTKTSLLLEFCTQVGMALHSHTIHDFLSQYRLGNVSTYLDLHQQVFDTLEQQGILENRNTGSALVSSDKIDIIKTLNALVELCEVCRHFPTISRYTTRIFANHVLRRFASDDLHRNNIIIIANWRKLRICGGCTTNLKDRTPSIRIPIPLFVLNLL